MISFICGKCGKKLATKDANAGRQVDCPKCGEKLVIPVFVPTKPVAKSPTSLVGRRSVLLASAILAISSLAILVYLRPKNAVAPVLLSDRGSREPQLFPASGSQEDIGAFMAKGRPEQWLAYFESGQRLAEDDEQVGLFKGLLGVVDRKYRDSPRDIAEMSLVVWSKIKDAGRSASLRQILQGAADWHPLEIPPPQGGFTFPEYANVYRMYRVEQKLDHNDAVDAMLRVERVVYAKSDGDQVKQAGLLRKAGIVEGDPFAVRAEKMMRHLEEVERSFNANANANANADSATEVDPVPPQISDFQYTPPPEPSRRENVRTTKRAAPTPATPVFNQKAETLYGYARQSEKAKRTNAAANTYRSIILEYPGTQQAIKAEARIKALGLKK